MLEVTFGALGVMIYEMLTGRRPFTGKDIREQILARAPKPPRQLNDQITESLESICLKCLEKKPQRSLFHC